jgi:hypothetical protein
MFFAPEADKFFRDFRAIPFSILDLARSYHGFPTKNTSGERTTPHHKPWKLG